MKIEINIEKKHLYFFAVFLLLFGTLTVIAVDNPNVFHEVLYVDILKSHATDNVIDVSTDLKVGDNNKLKIGPWEISQSGGGAETSYLKIGRTSGAQYTEFLKIDWNGKLYLKNEICDYNNPNDCHTLTELAGGVGAGGVGGESSDVSFTYTGEALKY